jgi:hypothetical protein
MRTRLVVILALSLILLATADASAKPAKPLRDAAVKAVSVSPASSLPGGSVQVWVTVRNTGTAKLPSRPLLVRLGAGRPVLASKRIPRLRPGRAIRLSLTVPIPRRAQPGLRTLRACRAWRVDRQQCGGARTDTPFTVMTPVSDAKLTLAPSTHDFGEQVLGSSSAAETFTVTNSGGEPSGAPLVALEGVDSGEFALASNSCSAALAPGASCSFDVSFAPSSSGEKSAEVQVSGAPGGTTSANLSGTALTPANLEISPASHDFGTQTTGTSSAAQSFTVTNSGEEPSGSLVVSIAGDNPEDFQIIDDTCTTTVLAAAESCSFGVVFAPGASGPRSAAVSAQASPGGTASADLSGTGQTPPHLVINPTEFDFGTQPTGTTSDQKLFTVTNTGDQDASLTSVAVDATDNNFRLVDGNCGATLPGGVQCDLAIVFSPPTPGSQSGSVTVDGGPGGSPSATLTGTGQDPAHLKISPTAYDFGNVLHGTTSQSEQFTLANTGDLPASVVQVSLDDSVDFAATSDCPGTLAGHQSCTTDVQFTPYTFAEGPLSTTLRASSPDSPEATAALSGNAVTTPADLETSVTNFGTPGPGPYGDDTTFDFGNLQVGPSTQFLIWIHNSGEADAWLPSAVVPLNLTSNVRVHSVDPSSCNVVPDVVPNPSETLTSVTFSELKIAAGSECSISLTLGLIAAGHFSVNFAVTGTPGGTISATFEGTGV